MLLFAILLLYSCNELRTSRKEPEAGFKKNVDVHFQVGFDYDTLHLFLSDSAIYTEVLNTNWSLGYSNHVLIDRTVFEKKKQLRLKVRNLEKIIIYKSTYNFINVSIIGDSLKINYTDTPFPYM